MNENRGLFDFLRKSPTAFHAAEQIAQILREHGYTPLDECEDWSLTGGKYYVMRAGTSIIALSLPERPRAWNVIATHTDSPTFKLKQNALTESCGIYARLNTEKYGGTILPSWLDRPLSIAGRIVRETADGVQSELYDAERDLCMIPSVAPHLDRDKATGTPLDIRSDLLPLIGEADMDLHGLIGEGVLSHDLYLYNRQEPTVYGANGEFIGGARLDNLQCTYAALQGLLGAEPSENAAVFCAFDNEEVGSATLRGADSEFLTAVLTRICDAIGIGRAQFWRMIASSFLLSADNAHALHPNHPELSDADNSPRMNGGVVIKHNANQRYTTDALSAAVAISLAKRAGVPCQTYANRSDKPGGSTLGGLLCTHLPMLSADVGLAQLAMHSAYETAGSRDTAYFTQFAKTFYESTIKIASGKVNIQ